ncbi:pseudouridine synthase [Candidatus Latescibacterota bacterium]
MRLNRYVAMSGAASRRKAEQIIRAGRVAINGVPATDPARSVSPATDRITLDGTPLVVKPQKRVILLNKPTGVIVSVGDTHGRTTVMDLLGDDAAGLFPVGRLDRDTSGVLLLTNDGDLAHRLMHPSYGVEKVYRAEVAGSIGENIIARFRAGIDLADGPTAPAGLVVVKQSGESSLAEVTLHQGRKRQVRRMLEAVGHPVRSLERISFGGITAKDLKRGKYRQLTPREVASLKAQVGLE